MTLEQITHKLENELSGKRFAHSLNVMHTAIELARIFGADENKAAIAGLLHDCARNIEQEKALKLCRNFSVGLDAISVNHPILIHGPLGSILAREVYHIEDKEVLDSIRWHTTGCENMTLLSKIIFVADFVEPGRCFCGVDEARKLAYTDIDKAVLYSLDNTIKFVIDKGALIHHDTIKARNYIINQELKKNRQ